MTSVYLLALISFLWFGIAVFLAFLGGWPEATFALVVSLYSEGIMNRKLQRLERGDRDDWKRN